MHLTLRKAPSLSKVDARFALIGGLALASHNVIGATQNIDLLTDSEKAEDIDRELVALGYRCLHRSADAGNYLRGDGGITHVPAATSRDPFEALDDLMTVIEALCPVWPNREIFSSTDRFLI
jgi:hypothetical protein